MKKRETESLSLLEWWVVFAFLGLVITMDVIAWYSSALDRKSYKQEEVSSKSFCVHIEGAVLKPGTYECKPGTFLSEILEKVGLKNHADLSHLPKIFWTSTSIYIPETPLITVQITGAVRNPGVFFVHKGTRWEELQDLIEYTISANTKYLQKKKLLKDGDEITIPELSHKKRKNSTLFFRG